MIDIIIDTIVDALKILPFLFLTYLAMEYVEHKASDRFERVIKHSGKFGPALGGLIGAFPQCGFSAAASNFYAGRMITLGTLIAVFLSTSDEMLPIMISSQAPLDVIMKILLMKIIIGMIAGYLVDLLYRQRKENEGAKEKPQGQTQQVGHFCENESCRCNEHGIFKSALKHTGKIIFFIVVISFLLNIAISLIGEDTLAGLLSSRPVIGPVLAGIVGLIPNCAASIVITELYLEGILGLGAMMSGLLAGAGIGLLILFRVNDSMAENLKITGLLYALGVAAGIIIEFSGLVI